MAITNRALDVSEQKQVIRRIFSKTYVGVSLITNNYFAGVAAGLSLLVCSVPVPSVIKQLMVSCENMTNSLILAFNVKRFIAGTGITVINNAFGTLGLQNFSVSGAQSVSLPAAGSSLLSLLAGDEIIMIPTGAAGLADDVTVDLVIQAVNDVKQIYGSST